MWIFSIGDDIERIRQRRNEFGHSKDAYLCTSDYTTLIKESRAICQRMDAPAHSSHFSHIDQDRPKFLPWLETIEKDSINTSLQELYSKGRPNEMKKDENDLLKNMNILLIQQKEIEAVCKFFF